jgi:HK97 family phage major capsid protein
MATATGRRNGAEKLLAEIDVLAAKSRRARKGYSLRRALFGEEGGPEQDISRELRRYTDADGLNPHADGPGQTSTLIPWAVLTEKRAGELTIGTEGTDIRETDVGPGVEVLRQVSVVAKAGGTFLENLRGDLRLPRVTAGSTATWLTEAQAASQSTPTFDSIVLSPKSARGYIDITRAVAVQASQGVDELLRRDLLATVGQLLDKAALHGAGSGGEPTGIINVSGIGDVAGGTNGLAPAQIHLAELESDVGIANADLGRLAFVTNSQVRSKLRRTESFAGAGPIWAGNTLLGWPAYCTQNVRSDLTKGTSSGVCSAIFFGLWSELLVALWGPGLEVVADKYSLSTTGVTRLNVYLDVDIGVRHAASWSVMKDALTV